MKIPSGHPGRTPRPAPHTEKRAGQSPSSGADPPGSDSTGAPPCFPGTPASGTALSDRSPGHLPSNRSVPPAPARNPAGSVSPPGKRPSPPPPSRAGRDRCFPAAPHPPANAAAGRPGFPWAQRPGTAGSVPPEPEFSGEIRFWPPPLWGASPGRFSPRAVPPAARSAAEKESSRPDTAPCFRPPGCTEPRPSFHR